MLTSSSAPDDRPPDRAEPADDDHCQHEDREPELELAGVDQCRVGAEERAGHAAECRAHRVGESFVRTSGIPIETAATSSSRSAIQARPSRESRTPQVDEQRQQHDRVDQPVPRSQLQLGERPEPGKYGASTPLMPRLPAVSGIPRI